VVFNKHELNNSIPKQNLRGPLSMIYFSLPDESRSFKRDNNIILTIKTNLKENIIINLTLLTNKVHEIIVNYFISNLYNADTTIPSSSNYSTFEFSMNIEAIIGNIFSDGKHYFYLLLLSNEIFTCRYRKKQNINLESKYNR
jgi:hypothetical protein